MDSYREFPSEFELNAQGEPGPAEDIAAQIGTDERRMHVRAYNYWAGLLDGRDFPSIEDLEPNDVSDFSGHSVLLDFTCGRDNPAIPYIGSAIREECGLDDDMQTIAQVPSRSLLSRLTDHYLQIIANRAPVGFEAEFVNQRDETICYRGILMPFSSDGEEIDFIYGVINWKKGEGVEPAPAILEPAGIIEDPVLELDQPLVKVEIAPDEVVIDPDAGLADRLVAARESAEAVKVGEGRTRAALYQALGLAYDFALAARDNVADYEVLLADSGVKAQARAPMTPIVKLVFGADYDKARLTEFAAALAFADRQSVGAGQFADFIARHPGGLKALVAAERESRRPDRARPDRTALARARLRQAPPLALDQLGDAEFTLVITRRLPDGSHAPVAAVHDDSLLERALRKAD